MEWLILYLVSVAVSAILMGRYSPYDYLNADRMFFLFIACVLCPLLGIVVALYCRAHAAAMRGDE
jgi:hypothetical protein